MELNEIRDCARSLGFTRDQALFLADRIRNALVVLDNPLANLDHRSEARTKLLATIEAIEESTMAIMDGRHIRRVIDRVEREAVELRAPFPPGRTGS